MTQVPPAGDINGLAGQVAALLLPLGLLLVKQPGEALRHVIVRHRVPDPVDPDHAKFKRESICDTPADVSLLHLNLRVLT